MRYSTMALVLVWCVAVLSLSTLRPAPSAAGQNVNAARTPLILDVTQGERRTRRVMGGAQAIIKVDRRNGGAQELVMGYEEIPPGQAIQAHRHPGMDEIIFVHRGTGAAELGDRTATVNPGSTIFIPQGIRVMLRNTGTESLAIAFFFPRPGYEEYLRDTSVPDGRPAPPLSGSELAQIRERHRAHITFDPQ